MMIRRIFQWFIFLLFMIMLLGCGQSAQRTVDTSPEALNGSVSVTPSPYPTLMFPATNTPIPSLTPTSVPILPAEDALQKLFGLLANNGNCQLPCLWGITSGKSTNTDTQNILIPLSSIALPDVTYFGTLRGIPIGAITLHYAEDIFHFNASLGYDVFYDDDIVKGISFQVTEEKINTKDEYGNPIKIPVFDSKVFQNHTNYYSLAHVLAEQGTPNEVWLQAWGPLTGGGIDIALLYPDQGIWVNYSMKNIYQNGVVKRGCPINSLIEMQLFPSGDSVSFFSMLNKTDWGVTKGGYLPLETATSLSVQEFYEIFRVPNEECIETPMTLWPTPEGGDSHP